MREKMSQINILESERTFEFGNKILFCTNKIRKMTLIKELIFL